MGHEATVSKVSDDQLFYLMSRGLTEDEAMAMIVRGFIEPIAKELPMEYALELNRLIETADGRRRRLMRRRYAGTQRRRRPSAQALRSYDVADFPALTGREEEWRFTPLKRLRGLATGDAGRGDGACATSTASCRPASPCPPWTGTTRGSAAC